MGIEKYTILTREQEGLGIFVCSRKKDAIELYKRFLHGKDVDGVEKDGITVNSPYIFFNDEKKPVEILEEFSKIFKGGDVIPVFEKTPLLEYTSGGQQFESALTKAFVDFFYTTRQK